MHYGVLVQCLFHGRVSGFLRSLRRSHSLFGQHGGRSLLVKISLRRLHVDWLVLFVLMQWGEGGSFIYKLYLHGNCGVLSLALLILSGQYWNWSSIWLEKLGCKQSLDIWDLILVFDVDTVERAKLSYFWGFGAFDEQLLASFGRSLFDWSCDGVLLVATP